MLKKNLHLISIFLLAGILLFTACKKDEENTDNNSNTNNNNNQTEQPCPCNPSKNSFMFINTVLHFTYVHKAPFGMFSGWCIDGVASQGSVSFEFSGEPADGIYLTAQDPDDMQPNECVIDCMVGTSTIPYSLYVSMPGDSVYVENNGNGKFVFKFCSVTMESDDNGSTYTTRGNLTLD